MPFHTDVRHFFISYNKADRDWSLWADWVLRANGYTTFTQFGDIPWGSNFVMKMNEGLKEAERMILLLSPDFLASGFTNAEWTAMFKREAETKQTLLYPIRVRECDVDPILLPRVYLDLIDQDEAGATKTICDALNQLHLTPANTGSAVGPAPAFPYVRWDFAVEYCDADRSRVDTLVRDLESRQKKVWRNLWKDSPAGPAQVKPPSRGSRYTCYVVYVTDETPLPWAENRIRETLDLQRTSTDPDIKFIPVVSGSAMESLQEQFPEIRFWAAASNAVQVLMQSRAPAPAASAPARSETDKIKEFLENLKELAPLLNPDVVQKAQQDAIADMRKSIYDRRR